MCALYIRPDDACPFITEICSSVLDEYMLCWLIETLVVFIKATGMCPLSKNLKFHNLFTRLNQQSLLWATRSTPYPPFPRLEDHLNSHLHLDFPSGLYSSYLLISCRYFSFLQFMLHVMTISSFLIEWL